MVNMFLLLVCGFQWMELYPSAENYYLLSTSEFFQLGEVNQEIDPENLNTSLLEAAVFHASNEVRANKKKAQYTHSPILQKSARFHSEYLYSIDKLDHLNRKEKKYRTPSDRIKSFGGSFYSTAENLAQESIYQLKNGEAFYIENGQFYDGKGNPLKLHTYASLARKVLDDWMHSKGHRQNLMDDYAQLGCGVSAIANPRNNTPYIYITQNFGTSL